MRFWPRVCGAPYVTTTVGVARGDVRHIASRNDPMTRMFLRRLIMGYRARLSNWAAFARAFSACESHTGRVMRRNRGCLSSR
jgi:hypothetical protein